MSARATSIRLICAVLCAFVALVWGGVAMMMWAALDAEGWALWVIPSLPLVVAGLVFAWPMAADANSTLAASVKKQIEKDLQLFDEIL